MTGMMLRDKGTSPLSVCIWKLYIGTQGGQGEGVTVMARGWVGGTQRKGGELSQDQQARLGC